MLMVPDPLDPNFLDFGENYEYRIYLDSKLDTWAIVDQEDYQYFSQWCWCIKRCKRLKEYARRAVGENAEGKRLRTYTLYLHIEIMKRTGILPPSPTHIKVDHRNGNSLDCRRKNLRWATNMMNSRNINGSHPHDLVEGQKL